MKELKNLKIVAKNLDNWTTKQGQSDDDLNELQFNYKSSNWIMVLLFLIAYVLLIFFVYYFTQQVNSLKKYNAIIAAVYVALSYFLFTFYSFPTTLYLQKISLINCDERVKVID